MNRSTARPCDRAAVADAYCDKKLRNIRSQLHQFFVRHANEDHEDLSQEALLRYWRARDSFRFEASPETFVFAIASNVLKQYYRSKKCRIHSLPSDQTLLDTFAWHEPAVDEGLALKACLRHLSPYHRSVLHLLYWRELTTVQASRRLQRPSASVRRHHFEAKSELRRLLSGQATE